MASKRTAKRERKTKKLTAKPMPAVKNLTTLKDGTSNT